MGNAIIKKLENSNRKFIDHKGHFHVLEYQKELSPYGNATEEYFKSQMETRKRQLMIDFDGREGNAAVVQAGAMQWMAGNVENKTGIKGVGDLAGKMFRGKVTGESAIKPEYYGDGMMMLEPTYKHIILIDVEEWGPNGITVEDGMFLACDNTIKQQVAARKNISSAALGNEGLFNLNLRGSGVAAFESFIPEAELMEVELNDSVLKLDGRFAICWSGSLQFTVEASSKSLLGSAVNGEGLVNVYRGTGKVLMAPTSVAAGAPMMQP